MDIELVHSRLLGNTPNDLQNRVIDRTNFQELVSVLTELEKGLYWPHMNIYFSFAILIHTFSFFSFLEKFYFYF